MTYSIPIVAKSLGWFFMYPLQPFLLSGFHIVDLRAFVNTRFTSIVNFLLNSSFSTEGYISFIRSTITLFLFNTMVFLFNFLFPFCQ